MRTVLRPAVMLFAVMTFVTGIVYPLIITGIARLTFPIQAAGSLIMRNDSIIGSSLIGQSFSSDHYFWGRPSATSPMPYNAAASSGSNLGPLNPALIDAVKARVDALQAADPQHRTAVPVDLVTASASGLDPHISVAAADYQSARVAKARGISKEAVDSLVSANTHEPVLRFLGEPTVNVLQLNLALDALTANENR